MKKESISDTMPVVAEPKWELGGPQNSLQIEDEKASHGDLTKESKQLSETQGDDVHLSSECRHQVVETQDKPRVEASAMVRHSTDEICSKLELFLEQRDILAETKLKELFAAAQSNTAKENLLLSLR